MQTSLFSNNIRVRHVSDGTTDTFSCTIELIDESYLQVYFGETLQPTGWTYDESFQQVVFDEIPAEGTIITFLRYFPTIYTKSITEKGIINPEVLDNQMVEMVARIQTVEEKLSRTPIYPINTEKSSEEVYDDFKRIENVATSAANSVLETLEEIEEVRNEAVTSMSGAADAAKTTVSKYVDQTLIPLIKDEGQESIDIARIWATGEQAEVEAIEAGQLSSRGYMATTKGYMETTQGYMDTTQGYMDTTQGYMTTTEGYMDTTQGYMTTTEGYMDTTQGYMNTTEAAVAKLEEVDTVVANAKVEITDLSASEQTNIQNTAAASRDAAVTTISNTKDAAVVTVNETRDAAVNTVNSTKNSSVTAVNETRDAAVNTVNSTKNSSVTAVNQTKEAAIASIEEKASSYVDKTSDQTISGDKTFTGEVNVPTPASDAAGTTAINAEWANSRIISIMEDVSSICGKIYPVGSIYIGTQSTCPIASLIEGSTWELVAKDRVLQGAGTRGTVGTTLEESLPNITGSFYALDQINAYTGAFYRGTSMGGSYGGSGTYEYRQQIMNANKSSSAYQDGAPVQPDAYLVNIWRRTA